MIFETLHNFALNFRDELFGPRGSFIREVPGQIKRVVVGDGQVTGGLVGAATTVLNDPGGTVGGFTAAFGDEQRETFDAVRGAVGVKGFTVVTLALVAVIAWSVAKVFG